MIRIAFVVFGLLAAGIGQAAVAETRLALVIGVAAYGDDRSAREAAGFVVPGPLANTLRDANLMGDALQAQGFQVQRVLDPDRRALIAAVGSFARRLNAAGPDAVGVVYYAGHGAQGRPPLERDIDNYLIPIGASLVSEADLESEAVGLSRLSDQLTPGPNSAVVLILDACRNFALPASSRSGFTERGLAEARAAPGTLIAYSTRPGDVAADGPTGGNGPYAAALAREIRSAQGKDLYAIFIDTRRSVLAATGESQQPWENSSLLRAVRLGAAASPEPRAPPAVSATTSSSADAVGRGNVPVALCYMPDGREEVMGLQECRANSGNWIQSQ